MAVRAFTTGRRRGPARTTSLAWPALLSTAMSERDLRVELAACYRLVALFGWDDLVFTHISARLPGEHDAFLINPYGMLFEEITATSLVKVDRNGEKLAPSDWPVNPAGFVIHSAIHAARLAAAIRAFTRAPSSTPGR